MNIRTVKSLQIRAHGDNARPRKTMRLCCKKHVYVSICLPGCVRQSGDWKLSRVFVPLRKNTRKLWPALAYTIRYGCNNWGPLTDSGRPFSLRYCGPIWASQDVNLVLQHINMSLFPAFILTTHSIVRFLFLFLFIGKYIQSGILLELHWLSLSDKHW